ncbi:MAG: iron chaperone [Parvibaculaceae bacterium]
MAKTDYKSVDDYVAAQPDAVRGLLEEVRAVIRKALPKAEEVISYQIPAYKIDGAAVVFFAGWKAHYSLYPATKAVVTALKTELAPYGVEKGTVRFPLDAPVPKRLIATIAKTRAEKAAAEVAKKTAAKRKKAAAKRKAAKKSGR